MQYNREKTYYEKTEKIEREVNMILSTLKQHNNLTFKELLFYVGYSFIDQLGKEKDTIENRKKRNRLKMILSNLIDDQEIKKEDDIYFYVGKKQE